ncbi:MAG: tyrosine-type recombinase/integrase [Bacteroidota bacterium]
MALASGSQKFLKYLRYEKRSSVHTQTSYETDLTQFGEYLEQTYEVTDPEAASHTMIRSWLIGLTEEGIGPSSINRKIACLRSLYKFLLREGLVGKNPMIKVRVLKTPKRLPHFVRESEMVKVLDNREVAGDHDGLRGQLVMELLYGTGMRLSELTGLKELAINFHDRTLKVLGKRNKERVIPFAESLVPLIKAYIAERDRTIVKKDHGFLLVTDDGEQLYPVKVNRIVKQMLKDGGSSVEKKSPHVLRHTYATHLLDKGAEINAVKELLGHTSLAATQVYTHNSMEKLKKVFDQAHPKA